MEEVEVKAVPLELLAGILAPERADHMFEAAARARAAFGDRTIWHVNATAHGGGVAEMLQTLLAYGRGARHREPVARARWRAGVLRRHEAPAQPLARVSGGRRAARCRRARLVRTCPRREPRRPPRQGRSRDIVLLHDPQTAGMVDGLRATGVRVVWRCHVGSDTRNDETDEAWAFLRHYLERADAFVFSRAEYVPEWMDGDRVVVIPPSIDPFSAKNRDLDRTNRRWHPGDGGPGPGHRARAPISFQRRDGSLGTDPAAHRPHRRRSATASGREAHRPGQPLGSAQGHGRRAHQLHPDGRRRSRRRPPGAGRPGRVRGDRRPGGRRRPHRVPGALAQPARAHARSRPPRVHPDGRRRRERHDRERLAASRRTWSCRRASSRASVSPSPKRCGRRVR